MDMAFHTAFAFPGGPDCDDSGHETLDESGRALRPLGWTELCARLLANHDFRAARATQGSAPVRDASFHGSAAQWLAMLHGSASDRRVPPFDCRFAASENEVAINPTPLVAGKGVSGIALLQAGGATSAASAHGIESEMSA